MTAAAVRKLQKEIENVLKKVDDNICEFADHWEQAQQATSPQQKERAGEELKKCINKLQRLRSQIREWLSSNGVQADCKDKLEDARKRVECDMQRFKDFEREVKTKAFSTNALARGDELDLAEDELLRTEDWLSSTLQSLGEQKDRFEADLEVLARKRSLNGADSARQQELKTHRDRHQWHIGKLEHVLRALRNGASIVVDVMCIKDSIDYYVDNNQEDENCFDEGVYDSLELGEADDGIKECAPDPAPVDEAAHVANKEKEVEKPSKAKENKRRKEEKKEKKKQQEELKKGAAALGKNAVAGQKGSDAKPPSEHKAKPVAKEAPLPLKLEQEEVKVLEEQVLTDQKEEFICKICLVHVAGNRPKLTSCSHLFCGDCIEKWFAEHPQNQTWADRAKGAGEDRRVPCPVCKQQLRAKDDLYGVGESAERQIQLLWRMISGLTIVCCNHPKVRAADGECDWQGTYGTFQAHIKVCKNEPGACAEGASGVSTSAPMAERTRSMDSFDLDSGMVSTTVSTPATSPREGARRPQAHRAPGEIMLPDVPMAAQLDVQEAATPPADWRSTRSPQVGTPSVSRASSAGALSAGQASTPPPRRPSEAGAIILAVGDFDGGSGQQNQIAVREGDRLIVVRRTETGWTYATNLNLQTEPKTGYIPDWIAPAAEESQPSPTVTAPPLPQAEPEVRVRVSQNFDATGGDQLSLKSSDIVAIITRHESGWTRGRKVSDAHGDGPEGWFPDWAVGPAIGE